MLQYEEQYKKRLEKHKKMIQKQLDINHEQIIRHHELQHYIHNLHLAFLKMLSSQDAINKIYGWAESNGVNLTKEIQQTESSLKVNRMDLFEKVQKMEKKMRAGFATDKNADIHKMPAHKQDVYIKALSQNSVLINEAYEKGSPADKREIENWLLNNDIDPSKLKEGMTVADLI